ncbi:unnamed protein product [Allacma fusca]|uniref:DUF4789 domain-containing protein n=1 Tax=Allacma fusca TaxID=39272 RepID=A0A8J2KXC9_9HEXA|nr:unnamed protein product [Allacma fusca]
MFTKLLALLGFFSSAVLFMAILQPSSTYCFSLSSEESSEEHAMPNKLCSGCLYFQGPCPEGQWLVPRKDEGPKCEDIPCVDEYNAQSKPFSGGSVFLFSHQDKCYTSGTADKGPCSANEIAYFLGHEHECSAFPYGCAQGGTLGAVNECEDESEPDFQGGCEPSTSL